MLSTLIPRQPHHLLPRRDAALHQALAIVTHQRHTAFDGDSADGVVGDEQLKHADAALVASVAAVFAANGSQRGRASAAHGGTAFSAQLAHQPLGQQAELAALIRIHDGWRAIPG